MLFGLPWWLSGKDSARQCRRCGFDPWVRKIPWGIGETGIRAVVCGGDIPEAFGDRASLDASVARYRDLWIAAVERAGGDFLPVHGNHDFAIRAAAGVDEGYTYPAAETRAIMLDTAAVRARAVADPGSCAYYADFPEMRVRLVVADIPLCF